MKALVVEDDRGLAGLLAATLDGGGYAVTIADSAIGAAELTRRAHPDVILLDLGLPYRSGASLLAELKAAPDTAPIPVIIVSALADSLTAERRAMAVAVVDKPFSPQALLDVVHAARRPGHAA